MEEQTNSYVAVTLETWHQKPFAENVRFEMLKQMTEV